jgi:cytochrome c oxidase subunit III
VRPMRAVADVSSLPTTTFGNRGILWWGTLGFIVIEGSTLAICALTYFYLRKNFYTWPPQFIPRPALGLPTVQAVLMLASIGPIVQLDRAARRMDLAALRRWMTVAAVFSVLFPALRWFELQALHVRWDSNAYGSAAWAIVVAHGTLLLVNALETVSFAVLLFRGPMEEKHFSDAEDAAVYWYFMTIAWLPLYAMVFLSPYLM